MQPLVTVNFILTRIPLAGNLAAAGEETRMTILGARTRLNFTPLYAHELDAWKQARNRNTPPIAHVLAISLQDGEVRARLLIGLLLEWMGSGRLYTTDGQVEFSVCEEREYPLSAHQRAEWLLVLAEQGSIF